MRAKGHGHKKAWAVGGEKTTLSRMSVDVSPVRYPGRKRKSPQGVHPAGKKKKEKENVGWPSVKCPIQPCLLFCGQDQALEYMKAVYSQPHPEVLDMWCCLQ